MFQRENEEEKFSWNALEYEHKERSRDWFWALGVIVVAGSLASIIFGNYFFGALIIISGGLLGFFATKTPDDIRYELNHKGLRAGGRLYPYENIKSFWVQTSYSKLGPNGQVMKPLLFIKSERVFMPVITIPIEDYFAEDIHTFLTSKDIKEEEMAEHPGEKIMDVLGF